MGRSDPAGPSRRRAPRRRLTRRDVTRAVSWHRRKLAVVAAVGAVLSAMTVLAPAGPPTKDVVRAVAMLPPGSTISASQVELQPVPESAVPDDSVVAVSAVVGRTVLAGVPAGQVLTRHSVVSDRSVPPGHVVAPLRLADPDVVSLLHPGDRVDVLGADGAGSATVLARRARIVALTSATGTADAPGARSSPADPLVLVDVDPATAAALAGAGVTGQLSVVLRS